MFNNVEFFVNLFFLFIFSLLKIKLDDNNTYWRDGFCWVV